MSNTVPISLTTGRDPWLSQTLLDHVQDYDPGPVVALAVAPASASAQAGDGVFTMTPLNGVGEWIPSFFNDWYFRIHLIPSIFEMGYVVSDQQRAFQVWNAYPDTVQTLTDATLVGGEGILVVPPGALPLSFAPLQLRTWQVSIGVDGPPAIAATWTFTFTGLVAQAVTITGARVVPWTFVPDWAEGIVERLGWRTDVMGSPSRDEQRRGLRQSPTRRFELRSLLSHAERSAFDLAVYSWGGRTWAMPVWPDIVWLPQAVALGATAVACDTAGRDFVDGGLALLRAAAMDAPRRYEVVEIQTVAADSLVLVRPTLQAWPAGSRLYPMRLADLVEQPQVRRLNDAVLEARYQFEVAEPCDWPAVMPATLYQGHPVLEQAPEFSQALDGDWERVFRHRDNPTGFGLRTDTAATPATLRQHRWTLFGRAEQTAHRSLLYALQGRFKALWAPTFDSDIQLAAPVSAATAALDIAAIDYPRHGAGRVGRRDIRIELADGTAFHRRITASATLDADTERLVIDSALGQDVAIAQVRRISFMALSRQNADETEIEHVTDADGTAKSAMTFRSIRDDL